MENKKTSLFLVICNVHKEVVDREEGRFWAEINRNNSNTKMKSLCRIGIINEKKRIL